MHITDNRYPIKDDIIINDDFILKPVDKSGYNWLGFWLFPSNVIKNILDFHFTKKIVHISSFYSWLDINRDTPIKIKLNVLYNCLFASLLYSCEAWGNINNIADKIRLIEKKALKSCLGVKSNIPDDIVYIELNKADIISVIMDRQYNFIRKFLDLNENMAISRCVWNIYILVMLISLLMVSVIIIYFYNQIIKQQIFLIKEIDWLIHP